MTSADYLLDGTHRRARCRTARTSSAPYYALTRRAPRRSAAARSPRTATAITGPSRASSCPRPSGSRTGGWRRFGYLVEQRARVLRQPVDVDRRSDVDDASTRRSTVALVTRADRRQRQVADLPDGAEVPVHRERLLRGTVGRELRRELPRPRRGSAQVFYANDVATNDAVHSSKDVVVITDLGKYRLPTAEVARLPRGEGLHVRPHARGLRLRRLQPAQQRHRARAASTTCRLRTSMQITEIMNPRIARFGVSFTF